MDSGITMWIRTAAAACLLGCVTSADGASMTYAASFTFADGLGDETVQLPQFDDLGGTRALTGVSVVWSMSFRVSTSFQNGLDVPQVVTAFSSPFFGFNEIGAWLNDSDVNNPLSLSTGVGSFDVIISAEANEFVSIEEQFAMSGSRSYFAGDQSFDSARFFAAGAGMLSWRIGTAGNEDGIFLADTFGYVDGQMIGGPVGDFSYPQWFDLSGSISVTYDFVVVPLPGAVWLGGAGMLAVGVIRRRASDRAAGRGTARPA